MRERGGGRLKETENKAASCLGVLYRIHEGDDGMMRGDDTNGDTQDAIRTR